MVYKPQINNGNTLNNGDSENGSTPNPAPLGEGEWLEMQPRLATMSSEQLIATVRRFACQCGVVALMTKEETAQAMRDVLAETALRPIAPGINLKADIQARLAAIDKWLDRDEGKPMQRQMIAAQIDDKRSGLMAGIEKLNGDQLEGLIRMIEN